MSALDTALDILDCFHGEAPELAVSELARRLGIAKSTVSRVMKTMAQRGLVEQDQETRRYSIGPLPFRIGRLYKAGTQIFDTIADALGGLVTQSGFTGYIGALDGLDVTILRMYHGHYPVRIVLDPGHRVPAFSTAMGLALLAKLGDDHLGTILPPVLTHPSMRLRRTRAQLLTELRVIRGQGWAAVENATFPGISAIGAAVSASPALGFALSFPAGAVTPRQRAQLTARIADAARLIESTSDPAPRTRRDAAGATLKQTHADLEKHDG